MLTGTALYVGAAYDGLTVDPTIHHRDDPRAGRLERGCRGGAGRGSRQNSRAKGPDAAQPERVKTQLRAAQIYSPGSAHGRAYEYGQGLSVGLGSRM